MSGERTYASPPCMAAEVDPTYVDPLGADAQQAGNAALSPRPVPGGVALAAAGRAAIHPQPDDIPPGRIVTETGVGKRREDPS